MNLSISQDGDNIHKKNKKHAFKIHLDHFKAFQTNFFHHFYGGNQAKQLGIWINIFKDFPSEYKIDNIFVPNKLKSPKTPCFILFYPYLGVGGSDPLTFT